MLILKGHNTQHSGHKGQRILSEKTIEIQLVRPTEVYVVKYRLRNMAKCLLKNLYHRPMLLMRTTKTAVCLQRKAIFHHVYGF